MFPVYSCEYLKNIQFDEIKNPRNSNDLIPAWYKFTEYNKREELSKKIIVSF